MKGSSDVNFWAIGELNMVSFAMQMKVGFLRMKQIQRENEFSSRTDSQIFYLDISKSNSAAVHAFLHRAAISVTISKIHLQHGS